MSHSNAWPGTASINIKLVKVHITSGVAYLAIFLKYCLLKKGWSYIFKILKVLNNLGYGAT
jgi:hypothetical protein